MYKYLQIAMMSLLVLSIHAPSNGMELSKFRGNIYTNTLPVVMHFPSLIADADRQFIKSYIMPVIGIASIMICYLAYKYYIAIFRPDRKQPDSSESNLPPRPRGNSTTEDTTSTSSERVVEQPSPKILPIPSNSGIEISSERLIEPRVDDKNLKNRIKIVNYIAYNDCLTAHQEPTVFGPCLNYNLITLDFLKERQECLNKKLSELYFEEHSIGLTEYESIAKDISCIQESMNKHEQNHGLEDSKIDNYADLYQKQNIVAKNLSQLGG